MATQRQGFISRGLTLLLLLATHTLLAQTFPGERGKLNYRLIGFILEDLPTTAKYEIEVATDSVSTEAAFKKNRIVHQAGATCKMLAEVPAFGKRYTWRGTYTDNKGKAVKTAFIHFSTLPGATVDTSNIRLRVTLPATTYKDAYVFSDITRAMYNMKGEPVWFLPQMGNAGPDKTVVRDLKLSPRGTITLLLNDHPYEIDYNGLVMWDGPDNGKVSGGVKENYHHEFTRLADGNYVVMGTETLRCRLNPAKDSLPVIASGGAAADTTQGVYRRIPFGTIIEYTPYNEVAWSWKASDFFRQASLQPYIKPSMHGYALHENAFFMDKANGALYVSSKHYSLVIKINYPEKTLAGIYGSKAASQQPGLFCEQHSCRISQKGYLYLFNNNECNPEDVPSVAMYSEDSLAEGGLQKVWEYKCPVKAVYKESRKKFAATTGGNVAELPDNSIFASLCTPYSNMFIVNQDKKLLWEAVLEKKEQVSGQWEPLPQYRASIVASPTELNKLIFGH